MYIGRVCVLPAEGDIVKVRWQPRLFDLVLAGVPVPVMCPLSLPAFGARLVCPSHPSCVSSAHCLLGDVCMCRLCYLIRCC